MRVSLQLVKESDAAEIAALRTAASQHLTDTVGKGPWTSKVSERAVLSGIRAAQVYVARAGQRVVATLTLTTSKPWSIDAALFSECSLPIYLIHMAVTPALQRRGIGQQCMEGAHRLCERAGAGAVRLDAFAGPGSAGGFYEKCGYAKVGEAAYRGIALLYYEFLLTSTSPKRANVRRKPTATKTRRRVRTTCA
jgi:GNAT superfamily N-acetyltransferase